MSARESLWLVTKVRVERWQFKSCSETVQSEGDMYTMLCIPTCKIIPVDYTIYYNVKKVLRHEAVKIPNYNIKFYNTLKLYIPMSKPIIIIIIIINLIINLIDIIIITCIIIIIITRVYLFTTHRVEYTKYVYINIV